MNRTRRLLALGAVGVAGVLALGGCAPGGHTTEAAARKKQVAAAAAALPPATMGRQYSTDDGSPAGVVEVKKSAFTPASFSIEAGQAMVWAFDDGAVAHHVVGDGFDSGVQTAGRFSHTFAAAGTHAYHCSIHPAMKGTITVTKH
jgi:plastocyanin